MFGNELPADQVAALEPGDVVMIESSPHGWALNEIHTGTVVRLTPKQIVVHYVGARGTIETRFRREDGRKVGANRGAILDPTHPTSVRVITDARRKKRQQDISGLSDRWARERDNLELLRRLHVAVGEYLDAES